MANATRGRFADAQKEKYMKMPLEEKRTIYKCGDNYTTLDQILTWPLYARMKRLSASEDEKPVIAHDRELNDKISVFTGDITSLEIDAIVNAANKSLAGGGGVDGAIHRAAGQDLKKESVSHAPCETGEAKVTGGYKLPAKYVIHTVGPVGERPQLLEACYRNSLDAAAQSGCKSVAFPCVSTGVYGYPNLAAAHVVLNTTRNWLETNDNRSKMDRIIYCLFMPVDINIYERLLHQYFPLT